MHSLGQRLCAQSLSVQAGGPGRASPGQPSGEEIREARFRQPAALPKFDYRCKEARASAAMLVTRALVRSQQFVETFASTVAWVELRQRRCTSRRVPASPRIAQTGLCGPFLRIGGSAQNEFGAKAARPLGSEGPESKDVSRAMDRSKYVVYTIEILLLKAIN